MHQWKGFCEYYTLETQKFDFFFQKSSKFKIWLLAKSWNHLNFDDISPTLVIDTSMEIKVFTSTTPWQPENLNFVSKKFEILNLTFDEELKSP